MLETPPILSTEASNAPTTTFHIIAISAIVIIMIAFTVGWFYVTRNWSYANHNDDDDIDDVDATNHTYDIKYSDYNADSKIEYCSQEHVNRKYLDD